MKINKYSNMVSSVNQSKQLKKEGATEPASYGLMPVPD